MEKTVRVTNIKTDVWNSIITMLIEDQWRVVDKYDNFDAGIDYDRVVLEKEDEKIEFTWDNWMEGEIQCNEICMTAIEKSTGITLMIHPAGRPIQE